MASKIKAEFGYLGWQRILKIYGDMIIEANIRRQVPNIINYLFALDFFQGPNFLTRKTGKNDQVYSTGFI